ncbi:MAG: flagellar type III secretion system pore protein FliP [Paludisphaera borealis]|uniref:flagellar type III secretion system pore protein FliP n=1 Tax=Paludisphaera borealis TaxID=1387353 RepID=UPI0028418510|nr:flagellar type III secretion system pore protein FliP [Paludisphaera borealis]MDR3620940.1 flagellar type III secretion system pore protein FliP [Paludisphaera borealis]
MRNPASLRSPRIAVLPLMAALLLVVFAAPCQAQEKAAATAAAPATGGANATLIEPGDAMRTVQSVVLFGLVSLAPVALLMITPFVRINIVLVLLRQALGSPQVPGNQVLMALSLLLSALVMRPVGERVYHDAVEPYMAGKASAMDSWNVGAKPIKTFMVEQILRTNHQDYLWSIYQHSAESKAGLAEPEEPDQFPLGVVAPAFILSELTTALMIGFYLYLPFLIIDLVVSSVLAAMGLFMLPPTLVAMPVKLIVFVLIDGWLLVAEMLLSGFSVSGA